MLHSLAASGFAGSLTTTWQQKGGRVIAPANAVRMDIELHSYLNTGWVAFDDVGVKPAVTKYIYAGSQRVALRDGNGVVSYLLADHLGSTAITADSSGSKIAELRYKAWGETRYSSGTTPTNRRYTGQQLDSATNLYWYNSRWYDPALSRWVQPDTIVPLASQGVQAWDRYAAMNNNPVKYSDETGHDVGCSAADPGCFISNGNNSKPATFEPLYDPKAYAQAYAHAMLNSRHASPFYATSKIRDNHTYVGPDTSQSPDVGLNLKLTHEQKATMGDLASNATSIVPVALHGIDGATSINGPLTVAGGMANGYSQWETDQGLSVSNSQHLGRAVVRGIEGMVQSLVANSFGLTGFTVGFSVGGPFGGFTGYTAGYLMSTHLINQQLNKLNNSTLYPGLGLNPR